MKKTLVGILALLTALTSTWWVLGSTGSEAAKPLIGRVHAAYQPLEDGKLFVLVIGSDARNGNPLTGVRSDAIHLVGLNTDTMRGGILNFPRDSYVSIPGHGTNRINTALFYGGPQLLVRSVEQLTGVHIDYWVLTAFQGFQELLRELGGIDYNVPMQLSDQGGSGAQLPAGRQHLAGWEVLQFARDRHDFPGGDVARTTNQAKILVALLKKLRSQVAGNPASLLRWMTAVQRNTSRSPSVGELFRLGVLATQTSPRKMRIVTVPVTTGSAGAASVVFISPSAQSIYARFRKTGRL
jgi:polyisoprenyl-teichoic acid--peptidoglycan teichoic acid transferase